MKTIKLIFSFSILIFSILSCDKDESKNPLPVVENGVFVKLEIKNRQLDFSNIETTSFSGTLYAPSNNVDHYDLYIRRKNPFGVFSNEYTKLLTVTTFPFELIITPQMIADKLNVAVTSLENGDTYDFNGFAFTKDGIKSGYLNIPSVTKTEFTLEQGFRFNTSLASPLDPLYNNRTLL